MSEIFSSKISKGSRTYFFDIKINERGDHYMTITESKKSGDEFERRRIMVFEENMQDFEDLFQETLVHFKKFAKGYKSRS